VAAHGHATAWSRLTAPTHHRGVATGRTQNATDGTDTGPDQHPPDIETMRTSVRRLLAENAVQPGADDLAALTLTLRGHMELLIPEVESIAGRLPEDHIPRYCALACVGEARTKLRTGPHPGTGGGIPYARRLARSLNALADHWENLNGVRPGAGR
jgi:hypothetical protein